MNLDAELRALADRLAYCAIYDRTTDDPDRWVVFDALTGNRMTALSRRGLEAWLQRRELEAGR